MYYKDNIFKHKILIRGFMNSSKKKMVIVSIAIAIFLMVLGTTVTVITIKNNNDKKAQEAAKNTPQAKKKAADSAKVEGVKAAQDGDSEKAKQLLLEAQAEYKKLNDTDNVVDTDAQLYFIEHPSTPPPAPAPETAN